MFDCATRRMRLITCERRQSPLLSIIQLNRRSSAGARCSLNNRLAILMQSIRANYDKLFIGETAPGVLLAAGPVALEPCGEFDRGRSIISSFFFFYFKNSS